MTGGLCSRRLCCAAWCAAVVVSGLLWSGRALAGSLLLGRITVLPFAGDSDWSPITDVSGITAGPDGNLWFTSYAYGVIGEISPSTHQPSAPHLLGLDSLLNPTSHPVEIVAGPDGNLWFGDDGRIPSIGEMNPSTGQVTKHPIPTTVDNPHPYPGAIAVGSDGNLWFTEPGSIGELDAHTDLITQYVVPGGGIPRGGVTGGTAPDGILAGPDGDLWFTAGSSIGEISPSTHQITKYPVPHYADHITEAPDGDLWFIGGRTIGVMDPASHKVVAEYPLPDWPDAGPVFGAGAVAGDGGITVGPDGNIWFTVWWNYFPASGEPQAVGEISPTTHTIVEFPVPLGPDRYPEQRPGEIVKGPDGTLWFGENDFVGTTPTAIDIVSPARAVVSGVNVGRDGTVQLRLSTATNGRVDVLETAWDDNLASGVTPSATGGASELQPAPGRFVFARASSQTTADGPTSITIRPDAIGNELVSRHRYPVTLRMWVAYTPADGSTQTIGYYGLHLASSCPDTASRGSRTKMDCAWQMPSW